MSKSFIVFGDTIVTASAIILTGNDEINAECNDGAVRMILNHASTKACTLVTGGRPMHLASGWIRRIEIDEG